MKAIGMSNSLRFPLSASLAILVVSTCGALAASGATTEFRTRFNIVGTDNRVHYELTEVVRLSNAEESNLVLVRDAATGERYVLERLKSYADRKSTWRIRDPKGETSIATSFPLPYTARSRQGALREARDNPALASLPAILTIETNGGSWSGLHTSWDDWSELRTIRHEIRRVTSFYLIEGIERMRDSVFAQPAGEGFHRLVAKYVVYDTDDPQNARLRSIRVTPSCEFDNSFGFPCTDAQKTRLRKAAERGQIPDRY